MTKYFVYADDGKTVVKKTKHEKEATGFALDYKNLSDYGTMEVIKKTDDGSFIWNQDTYEWRKTEEMI